MSRRRNNETKKRRGCGFKLLITLLFLAAAGGAAAGTQIVRDVTGMNGADKNYVIEIPDGAGTSSIANILRNRGIIDYPGVFKLYARMTGEPVYQKGRHTLNPSMSYNEVFAKLDSPPDQGGHSGGLRAPADCGSSGGKRAGRARRLYG